MLSALLIGFSGSLHCIGMCGAISLLIPNKDKGDINKLINVLFYNAGRLMTYGLLGLVAGIAGEGLIMAGIQKYITLALGILLLMIVFFGKNFHSFPFYATITRFLQPFWQKVTHLPERMAAVSIGILNGFIPCGMVYIALGGALIAGSLAKSIIFMLFFGLGTLPAMLVTATTGNRLFRRFQLKAPVLMAMVLTFSGVILIYRALYADIYTAFTGISPAIPVCH